MTLPSKPSRRPNYPTRDGRRRRSESRSRLLSMATTPNSGKKKKKVEKETKEEGPAISIAEEKAKSNNENQKEKKNKRTNEIDEIFQGIKRKKLKEAATREEDKAMDKKAKVKKKGDGKKQGGTVAGESHEINRPRRRKTADGLTIYSADEIGFGNPNAGGTPLCPFDCSCCF